MEKYFVTAILNVGQEVELTQDIAVGTIDSLNIIRNLLTDGMRNRRIYTKGTKAIVLGHENNGSPNRYILQIGEDEIYSVMEYMIKIC